MTSRLEFVYEIEQVLLFHLCFLLRALAQVTSVLPAKYQLLLLFTNVPYQRKGFTGGI